MKSSRGLTLIAILILIVILLAVSGLLGPFQFGLQLAKRTASKNDALQIANAIMSFETEYNKLPITVASDVTLNVEGELLKNLTNDTRATLNSRGILFIETWPWKRGKGGIQDGVWKDAYGNPFRVSLDGDGNMSIAVSTNGAVSGTTALPKRVAVWNVTSDPKQQVRSWK